MNRFIVPFVGLCLVSVTGRARPHPRPPPRYVINPLGVKESCLSHSTSRVTDHRVTPPVTRIIETVAMKSCAAGDSGVLLRRLQGGEWDGKDGYVTIRNYKLGRCLTNPATYVGNGTDKQLKWETCLNQQTGGPETMRQAFHIRRNGNGATQIMSQLMYALSVPNAVAECLERNTPLTVVRAACSGLGNWMINRL